MFLTNQAILTYAPETTYGTAPSSGYIPLRVLADPSWTPQAGETLEDSLILPFPAGNRQVNIRRHQTFTFGVQHSSSGTAGTAANYAGLFPSCKVSEALVANTSATYTPAVSTASSVTLRWSIIKADGTASLVHQMTGAMGNPSFTANNDEHGTIQFEYTGLYSPPTDGGGFGTTTYTNQAHSFPLIAGSSTFNLNSVAACLQSFEFNAGNEVVFTSRSGCSPRVLIVDSKPSGSITIEQRAVAAQDLAVLSTSGLTYPISVLNSMGGTGNTQAINIAAASFGLPSNSAGNDKVLLRTLPFTITGANPWSVVHT
jgi:hypothetical protein